MFSYICRSWKIGTYNTATPGTLQNSLVEDKAFSDSVRSENSSSCEEREFGRYNSRFLLEQPLERLSELNNYQGLCLMLTDRAICDNTVT